MNRIKNFTEIDTFVISLGVIAVVSGIAVSFDYFKIPDYIFFCLALFAFFLAGVSLMQPGYKKNIVLFLSIFLPFIISLFLKNQSWSFNSLNNGLSLIALSLSIILLPSARIKREDEQREIEGLESQIEERDDRIVRIETERDKHINRIENERDNRISRIEKERDDRISRIEKEREEEIARIEDKNKKLVNNLKQKSMNDLLTLKEQNRREIDLLKEKVSNLNDRKTTFKPLDGSSFNLSESSGLDSVFPRFSTSVDFSNATSPYYKPIEFPQLEFPQLEFPKPIKIPEFYYTKPSEISWLYSPKPSDLLKLDGPENDKNN